MPPVPDSAPPSIVWQCPPPKPMTGYNAARADALLAAVSRLAASPPGPAGIAGLELQVALDVLGRHVPADGADNYFWARKCRYLFVRPAVEPIACSYWPALAALTIERGDAAAITSALAGQRIIFRERPSIGRGVEDVGFEAPDVAARWLTDIAIAAEGALPTAALPAYVYARTIMAHPFSDGNGRFARLMVLAALGRGQAMAPAIALAPAFYRNANRLAAALTALSESGDWTAFNAPFLFVLEEALGLSTRMLAARR